MRAYKMRPETSLSARRCDKTQGQKFRPDPGYGNALLRRSGTAADQFLGKEALQTFCRAPLRKHEKSFKKLGRISRPEIRQQNLKSWHVFRAQNEGNRRCKVGKDFASII